MASVPEGILLGLGNPLLDITITEDESFRNKYGLEANNAIEADDSHLTMFDDIINHHKPTYIAGKYLCPSLEQLLTLAYRNVIHAFMFMSSEVLPIPNLFSWRWVAGPQLKEKRIVNQNIKSQER